VKGEQNMMAEMYARGPIACGVAVTKAFVEYSGGIFNDNTNATVNWWLVWIHVCQYLSVLKALCHALRADCLLIEAARAPNVYY
jgi:hypothetical protein